MTILASTHPQRQSASPRQKSSHSTPRKQKYVSTTANASDMLYLMIFFAF